MELIVARNQPLNEDLKAVLIQAMEHVATRIQELRSGPEVPAAQPEMTESMPSSNISEFAYDKDSGQLLVRFLGEYPNRKGSLYAYSGVPPQIFDLFRKGAIPARTNGRNRWGSWFRGKVPSMGASMHTLLKGGNYSYQKLT